MKYSFAVGTVVWALACSSDEGKSVVVVAEPLSNHEQCDTTPADAVVNVNDGFPPAVSTRSYGHPGSCADGFLVDVFTGQYQADVAVKWEEDGTATTADECALANVRAYVWDMPSPEVSSETYMGASSTSGRWDTSQRFCFMSWLRWPSPTLPPYHTYRYAVSARQYRADGSYARRIVSVSAVRHGGGGGVPNCNPGTGGAAGCRP